MYPAQSDERTPGFGGALRRYWSRGSNDARVSAEHVYNTTDVSTIDPDLTVSPSPCTYPLRSRLEPRQDGFTGVLPSRQILSTSNLTSFNVSRRDEPIRTPETSRSMSVVREQNIDEDGITSERLRLRSNLAEAAAPSDREIKLWLRWLTGYSMVSHANYPLSCASSTVTWP